MLEGTELPPEVQFLHFRFRVIPLFNQAPEGFLNTQHFGVNALEISLQYLKIKTSVSWAIKREGKVSDKVQF